MNITDDELIEMWQYFQYCCVPSIVMTKYAFLDYVKDIKQEKAFYRYENKALITKMYKILPNLPNKLMDVSSQNVRYMNIFSDNIDEQLEEETEELHKAIYITFRNAKMQHIECLAAIHYISAMLQIAVVTFEQCCHDMKQTLGKDPEQIFRKFNMQSIADDWEKLVDRATKFFGYNKLEKNEDPVDLNNPRCIKAIDSIRRKYADIETLRTAMKKSYPWSVNYREDIPYEKSVDNLIVNTDNNK